MTPSGEANLVEDFIIPAPSLSTDAAGTIYVSFSRSDPSEYTTGSFTNALKFVSKEVDPASGEPEEDGYEDEYALEEIELGAGDYVIPSYATFATEWDRLRTGASLTETFALSALESLKGPCSSLAPHERRAKDVV